MKALRNRIISIIIIAMMIITGLPVSYLAFNIPLAVHAADDIASGNYDGVPWKVTGDYELIIGEQGKEYTYAYKEERRDLDYPWAEYRQQIKKARIAGIVHGNGSLGEMFWDLQVVTSIDVSGLDTSNVTDMYDMFCGCRILTELDLSGFNTSKVTDFSGMFAGGFQLKKLNISGFDTSKATDISGMFIQCRKLADIDVSDFNTSNVTDISGMFQRCESVTSMDLSGWDTSKVTDMQGMFVMCINLKSIDLTGWDTRNVSDMSLLFDECSNLTTLDLSSFDTSNTEDMFETFEGCYSLTVLKGGKGFNTCSEAEFPVTMYDKETGEEYTAGTKIPSADYRVYVTDMSIDPDDEPPMEVHNDFYTTEEVESGKLKLIVPRGFTGDKGYYYKDSYFYKPATEYNQSLATMSLCMAFTAYGLKENTKSTDYSYYDKHVKRLMTECGFAKNGRYKEYNFNKKPTENSIGYVIGSKSIKVDGNPTTVIAVAVRGGGYEYEWKSNFTIGLSGDHYGFDSSAEDVKRSIISYITTNKIKGDVKVWITGFSRAGAVATQTAAKLNDVSSFAYEDDDSETGYNTVNMDKESIYAYGFATPAGADFSSDPHSSKYNNIWNVIEYNDPVPLVAPGKWKCDRYGTTKVFIYKESNNAYNQYIDRVATRLNNGKGYNISKFTNYKSVAPTGVINKIVINELVAIKDPFNHDTQGTVLRKSVKSLANAIGDRKQYSTYYQSTLSDTLAKVMNDNYSFNIAEVLINAVEIVPEFVELHPHLTVTLQKNRATLIEPHADQEYYIAWMQLMDPNYKLSLPEAWGNENYRVFKANCPVDLYVYDASNNVIASIVNEVPSDEENQEIIVSIDENGQKIAYLPVDSDYRVEVVAREDSEVSCGVEEYDAEFGEPSRVTAFETVPLEADKALSADVSALSDTELTEGASEGSSVDYTLNKDGGEVPVEADLRGEDEIAAHTYTVSASYDETAGIVLGGGSFTEGSFASLEAACNAGYIFDGFYIDGEKCTNDISEDGLSIRIKVTKDTDVEARFAKCEHHNFDWKITTAATEISTGKKVRSCNICGLTEEAVIPMLPPTLKAVKLAKLKAAKKSVTVTWKKVAKKNLKKIKKIEIQYSLDKNFSTGVKTKYPPAKKTSLKIKGLKSKKTYYVRIRAYTNAGGVIHVSKWSSTKKAKIR